MKSYLNSVLVIALVAFVATGCGKKKSKGSSGICAIGMAYCNPYGMGQFMQNFNGLSYDTTNMTYVTQWYQGQDPYIGASGLIDTKSITKSYQTLDDSFNPDGCFKIINGTYYVGQWNKSNEICYNSVAYNKSINTELTTAVSGTANGLTLLDVKIIDNGVYMLSYGPSYGSTPYGQQPTIAYVIDTKLHSLLNPIRTIDIASGAQDYLYGFKVKNITLQ